MLNSEYTGVQICKRNNVDLFIYLFLFIYFFFFFNANFFVVQNFSFTYLFFLCVYVMLLYLSICSVLICDHLLGCNLFSNIYSFLEAVLPETRYMYRIFSTKKKSKEPFIFTKFI